MKANRPELVAAALTALRAFILHGRDQAKPSRSRFKEWGDLIANALVFYGYQNPERGGDGIRAADPVKEQQREIARLWSQYFPKDAVTARELRAAQPIREAIADATGTRERDLTTYQVSVYVDRLVGVRP